jgi:hypothetical protein
MMGNLLGPKSQGEPSEEATEQVLQQMMQQLKVDEEPVLEITLDLPGKNTQHSDCLGFQQRYCSEKKMGRDPLLIKTAT